jgi:hypothetical protein
MAVDTVFGRSGDVVALAGDYAGLYVPLDSGLTLPIGGLAGQTLTKKSDVDLDVDWETPTPFVLGYTAEDVTNKVTNFSSASDIQYPSALLVQTALSAKLDRPVAIASGTHTKITYSVDGLVVAGADATTADIAEVAGKHYVSDAQLTALGSLSGVNTGDQDLSVYALASDLVVTNSNLAALSASLVNYALLSDLAATNTALADVTASLSQYALVSDLATTNAAISDLSDAVVAGYAPLDQFNTLQASFDALVANLSDPTWLAGTAVETTLTFMSGLTRVDNTVTNDLVTNSIGPDTFLGNTGGGSAGPVFGPIAAGNLSNGVTGSGKVVLDTSPTFTTPLLVGPATVKLSDSGVSTAPTVWVVEHDFVGGGSIVPGFGATLEFRGRSTTTSGRTQGAIRTVWSNPTDGSRTSNIVFSPVLNGVPVDAIWLHGDGSMALGTNAGSGVGVLWASGGFQTTGVGTVGNVLRDDGVAFKAGKLLTTDLSGQFSSCGTARTTTVDQTATAETVHLTTLVNANATVGTTWRVTVWGNIDNGATAVLFTPRLRWGTAGTIITPVPPTIQGTTTVLTGKSWRFEFLVTVTSVGSSGTVRVSWAKWEHTSQTSGAITVDCGDTGTTDVTGVNTTADMNLNFTWAMDVNTGAPHVRTLGGAIEMVRRYESAMIS